jgi:S-adenosyl methyltransferase
MMIRKHEPRVPEGVEGFELVEPGLVSLSEWRPDFNTDRTPLNGPTVGAVARLAA